MTGRTRRALIAPVLVVSAIVAFLALLWLGQRRLIYFPFQSLPPVALELPGGAEVRFETDDGLRLGGWYLPATEQPARATVLVANGNGGNRAMRAPLARALATRGMNVLLFDYRGYGGNPGSPTEAGLLADARAARDWLGSRGRRSTRPASSTWANPWGAAWWWGWPPRCSRLP